MRLVLALLWLLLAGSVADASSIADQYSWVQHPGTRLPMDIVLRDEADHSFVLRNAFAGVPVILDLGYYHCPTLCGVVRADLLNALANSDLTAGRDYQLVALSIDPKETAQDATQAKTADLTSEGTRDGTGWHYLTGTSGAVASIADRVGFRYRYDPAYGQFLHPTGLVILTDKGAVSSYLLGTGYSGGDLQAAVLRAGRGGIAKAAMPILLLCFHFDATTGRYTLTIVKLLQMMGGLTILTLGGLLLALHLHGRRRVG